MFCYKFLFKPNIRIKKTFVGAGGATPAPTNQFLGAGEAPTRPYKYFFYVL